MTTADHDTTSAPADFAAARPKPRHDGWTAERQRSFIEALAAWGSVQSACERIGMSPTSAYRLRAHPTATAFREAWDLAVEAAYSRLGDIAMERAMYGTPETVFYKGQPVGEQRRHDNKLLMFMLSRRDPLRFERFSEVYDIDTSMARNMNDRLVEALQPIDAACAVAEEGE